MRSRRLRIVCVVVALTACDQLLVLKDVAPDAPGTGPGDGPSSMFLVQQATGSAGSAMTVDASFTTLPASGHVLVMVGGAESNPLMTPIGGGATWHLAARSTRHENVEIWYGVTDGTTQTVTIMVPQTAASGPMRLEISEWSGLAGLLDGSAAMDGSASSLSTATAGAITTVSAPDLLIFGVAARSTIGTAVTDGPWSTLDAIQWAPVTQLAWYQVVQTAGTYRPATMVTTDWDAALAGFPLTP